jgi:flagellar biosynthetic protein FliP
MTTLAVPSRAVAQDMPAAPAGAQVSPALPVQVPDLTKNENISSTLQLIALVSILSLAPAILLMVTSFTRIIIVLSLLRQGIGAQQLPPNQVLVGLSLFMTFLIMTPTWQRVNNEALQP